MEEDNGNEVRAALEGLQNLEIEIRARRHEGKKKKVDGRGGGSAVVVEPGKGIMERRRDDLRDLTELAVWVVSTAKAGNGVEQLLDGNMDTYWQSDGPQPHTISAQFVYKVSISEIHLFLNYDKDESYTPAIIHVKAGNNFHDLRVVRRVRKLRKPVGWVRIPLGEAANVIDEQNGASIRYGNGHTPLFSDDDDMDDNDNEGDGDGDGDNEGDGDGDGDEEGDGDDDGEDGNDRLARNVRREQAQRRRERKTKMRQRALDTLQRLEEGGVNGHLQALKDRSVTNAHMIQIIISANHQNGRDSHVRMIKVLGPREQVSGKQGGKFTSREFQVYQQLR